MKSILATILFLFLFQSTFAQFPANPAKINGKPGDTTVIRICAPSRGKLIQPPLYIIFFHDRAVFRSDTAKLNAVSAINPRDIEKIDILKDSTAAKKYGSAAKNGVVLITLKKDSFTGSYKTFKADSLKTKRMRQ